MIKQRPPYVFRVYITLLALSLILMHLRCEEYVLHIGWVVAMNWYPEMHG